MAAIASLTAFVLIGMPALAQDVSSLARAFANRRQGRCHVTAAGVALRADQRSLADTFKEGRMRKLAILCAAAAASAGLAQALADPPARKLREAEGDPDQVVCRSEPEPGSRLKGRRVCLTQAQWRERRAQSRRLADEMQRFKPPARALDANTGMAC